MLLSLYYRFIYIANTRCASNTFERFYCQSADLAMIRTWHGKRCDVFTRYASFFRRVPAENFVVVGVIREPVDWVLSWFNFRCGKKLASPSHPSHANYCGDISFADFLSEMALPKPRPFARLVPQHSYFTNCMNQSPHSFVIPLPMLHAASAVLAEKGHLPCPLPPSHLNSSPVIRQRRADVTAEQATFIEKTFAEDLELYGRSHSSLDKLRTLPDNEPPSLGAHLGQLLRLHTASPCGLFETGLTRLTMPLKKALRPTTYAYH